MSVCLSVCPPASHQNSVRGIDGDLVVGRITVGQAEIEVLDLEVHIRKYQLGLDVVPNPQRSDLPTNGQGQRD